MADEEDSQESPSGLRAEIGKQAALAHEFAVKAALASGEYALVDAADFEGVKPEAVADRAKVLQEERSQMADKHMRATLEARGITDVDAFLENLGNEGAPSAQEQDLNRARNFAQGGVAPEPNKVDLEGVKPGIPEMEAHFRAQQQ